MEGLEKLHLVHARLLYIIAELHREGRIDDTEKLSLKQCVFKDDQYLFDIYEQNSQPEELYNLIDGLLLMVKGQSNLQGMNPDDDRPRDFDSANQK